jgi:hypothetical protein
VPFGVCGRLTKQARIVSEVTEPAVAPPAQQTSNPSGSVIVIDDEDCRSAAADRAPTALGRDEGLELGWLEPVLVAAPHP